MKIIDNFLQKDLFENLKLNLFSNMIDWHFIEILIKLELLILSYLY